MAALAALLVLVYEIRARRDSFAAISPQDLIRLQNQGALVLDIRKPEDHAAGHIAGSRQMDSHELVKAADNLKKSGAFIPGIRPGQQTGEYIDRVLTRLTLWGALYVAAVCLVPEIMISRGGVPFQFGGTSLLIVVVVAMDFMAQLQAHLMSHQYPGLLKQANLMGYGRGGAPQ